MWRILSRRDDRCGWWRCPLHGNVPVLLFGGRHARVCTGHLSAAAAVGATVRTV
jgi:hypothetical protein